MVADKKIAISMHKEQLAAALGEFAQRIRNRVHTATTGHRLPAKPQIGLQVYKERLTGAALLSQKAH